MQRPDPPAAPGHRLRLLAARWVGTPWWNLRFWLGYRIGGFTSAKRDY